MSVRKGPQRAVGAELFELRSLLGDAAIGYPAGELAWLQVEAELRALSPRALRSLLVRARVLVDHERERWIARAVGNDGVA